jgi:hypothetical protein
MLAPGPGVVALVHAHTSVIETVMSSVFNVAVNEAPVQWDELSQSKA